MDKKNFSFCKSRFRSSQQEEAHANEINNDIHLANTLFEIKVRQKKNIAAVCSGISLFMLALIKSDEYIDILKRLYCSLKYIMIDYDVFKSTNMKQAN